MNITNVSTPSYSLKRPSAEELSVVGTSEIKPDSLCYSIVHIIFSYTLYRTHVHRSDEGSRTTWPYSYTRGVIIKAFSKTFKLLFNFYTNDDLSHIRGPSHLRGRKSKGKIRTSDVLFSVGDSNFSRYPVLVTITNSTSLY